MEQQQGPRVAQAVGREEVEVVGEPQGELVAGGHGFDLGDAAKVVVGEALAGIAGERLGEARDVVGAQAEAAGRAMPAVAQQPLEQAATPASRSKAGMLRPEPLATPSVSLSRMVGRPVCSTTREATMPITPACQSGDDRTTAAGSRSGRRSSASRKMTASISWRSAFSAPEALRQRQRRGAVGRAEQLDDLRGVFEAPGGVQAGRQAKADGRGVDVVGARLADLEEGGQAGPRRAAQAADAHGREAAVLVEQGHDVGHGADRDHVEVRAQRQGQLDAVVATVFEQRVGQLERHAHAGQVGERVAAQLGVDDDAVGKLPDGLVVVGDDDVEAERAGVSTSAYAPIPQSTVMTRPAPAAASSSSASAAMP